MFVSKTVSITYSFLFLTRFPLQNPYIPLEDSTSLHKLPRRHQSINSFLQLDHYDPQKAANPTHPTTLLSKQKLKTVIVLTKGRIAVYPTSSLNKSESPSNFL